MLMGLAVDYRLALSKKEALMVPCKGRVAIIGNTPL